VQLDALARAELETIAADWREVFPAGGTYTMDAMRVLTAQKEVGNLTSDEALTLFMIISHYGTHMSDSLDLP
jgi:hypothetical protein